MPRGWPSLLWKKICIDTSGIGYPERYYTEVDQLHNVETACASTGAGLASCVATGERLQGCWLSPLSDQLTTPAIHSHSRVAYRNSEIGEPFIHIVTIAEDVLTCRLEK